MNRREALKITAMMMGSALSTSLSSAIAAGVTGGGKPQRKFIDTEARQSLQILAELIVPQTDTPGAIEAGVPDFIELMVSDWYTDTEREVFADGLIQLKSYCQKQFNRTFNDCRHEQQQMALRWSEENASSYKIDAGPGNSETSDQAPFFHKIKELTVLGYYTSEVGAKQELIYNPIPMKYDGDIKFSDVGRQWSY